MRVIRQPVIHILILLVAMSVLAFSCGQKPKSQETPATGLAAFTADAHTIALWHLDEGSGQVAADSSGHGYYLNLGDSDASETKDPSWSAAGVSGGCLDFIGAQQQLAYRSLSDPIDLSTNNQASVELWYRTTSTSGVVFWLGFINFAVSWTGYSSFSFAAGDDSDWANCYLSADYTASIADGDWHYIAATFDGSTMIVYLDGEEIGRAVQSTTLANPTDINLGGRNANTFVTGQIDEVRLSGVARTASEISEYYNR